MTKIPELIVIAKTYDLILWSCNHTGKFPRNHRFVLGERIERNLYDLLETLLRAKYTRNRQELLHQANLWAGTVRDAERPGLMPTQIERGHQQLYRLVIQHLDFADPFRSRCPAGSAEGSPLFTSVGVPSKRFGSRDEKS